MLDHGDPKRDLGFPQYPKMRHQQSQFTTAHLYPLPSEHCVVDCSRAESSIIQATEPYILQDESSASDASRTSLQAAQAEPAWLRQSGPSAPSAPPLPHTMAPVLLSASGAGSTVRQKLMFSAPGSPG